MENDELFAGLEVGKIYNVRARNFVIAVYIGDGKFIGIREKWFDLYLDTEYLRDHPQYGGFDTLVINDRTPIGEIPEGIPLRTNHPTVDRETKRQVAFDRPVADGGKGWFFLDTGEGDLNIRPTSYQNNELYDVLIAYEPDRVADNAERKEAYAAQHALPQRASE